MLHRIKTKHAHKAVGGTLTVGAVVTYALHAVSPELEAAGFLVTSLLAVWATDIENHMKPKGA